MKIKLTGKKKVQFRVYQFALPALFFFYSTFSFSQVICGGGLHSLALCSNSSVMAWGYNLNGQLGLGDTLDRHTPQQVHGPGNVGFLTGITALTSGGNPLAGVSFSLALKNDGTVWGWGWNHYGQLGCGDTISRKFPVQVSNLNGVIAIAGGGYHSFALKSDGTVWTWGRNYRGELGVGDTISTTTPVQVHGPGNIGFLTGIIAIGGGGWGHTLALKNDGTVWSWGQNFYGQLGLGDTTDRHVPTQVAITGITAISGGGGHSYVLKNDGTVWAWGFNQLNQMGDSTSTNQYSPVKVKILTGITAISGGAAHGLALKNDGTVWAWGFNQFGQIGDSTTANAAVPLQVKLLSGVSRISAGGGHSMVVKNDGTVWAWGYNVYGELGDGTTAQELLPIQVNGLCTVNGINELQQMESINAYPNPSSGVFQIANDKYRISKVEVYNVFGQKVYATSNGSYQTSNEIDLSSQPKGIYFMKVISEGNIIGTGKLIVE